VKMAPVVAALRRRLPDAEHVLVHTGQHYDAEMSESCSSTSWACPSPTFDSTSAPERMRSRRPESWRRSSQIASPRFRPCSPMVGRPDAARRSGEGRASDRIAAVVALYFDATG
jgi:hypothetical protein